jgi:catechol 2,3-dioxygenase-like lactoylglutathione lyase family enzyme
MTTTRTVPQHLSLVTLGVRDVSASRAFYEALGLAASGFESDDIAFFDMNGTVLALYGREALARDANVLSGGEGIRASACAFNVASETDVDAVVAHAEACGARITRQPERVFWGGYSGYFADPDGHLWEVACNPVTELDEHGRLTVPPPKT